jgi:hypothetical protein
MVADRSVYAEATQAWPATQNGIARGFERIALYRIDRMPMADVAERFSTLFDRAGLFLRVAGYWLVAAHQPSSRYGDGNRPIATA